MQMAMTKMSSKGQIVIPVEMRKDVEEGESLILIKTDDHWFLKKANVVDKALKEDLEFAKRTEAALKRYERGEFKEMEFDEFLEEMKKW